MASIGLPFLRKFNYIDDYFRTLYDLYADCQITAYPITYYSKDIENTIWDDNVLNSGSYERNGIGPLSGVKWKRITLFPVHNIEPIRPQQDTGEKGGITLRDSMSTQIVFPSVYGLIPLEGDVIDMNYGFRTPAINMKPMFTINNINPAHFGDFFQMYQCQLKPGSFVKDDIEKQVSSYWMFYEHDRIIVPQQNAEVLLNLQERAIYIASKINSQFYDKKTGFYINSLEIV